MLNKRGPKMEPCGIPALISLLEAKFAFSQAQKILMPKMNVKAFFNIGGL